MDESKKTVFFMCFLTLAFYFSGIFVFLTPLPFVFLILKRGYKATLNPVLATLAVVCVLYVSGVEVLSRAYHDYPNLVWILPVPALGLVQYFPVKLVMVLGISYFLFYLVLSVLVTLVLQQPKKVLRIMVWSIVGVFTVGLLLNAFLVIPQSQKILQDYRQYVNKGLEQLILMQEKAGADEVELVYLKSNVEMLVRYTLYLLPSFLLSGIAFLYVLNLVLAKRLFVIFFPQLTQIDLTRLRVPFYFVWFVVASLAAFLLNFHFVDSVFVHFFSLNLLIVLATLYLFQGFAVMMFVLDSRKIFGFFRLSLYLFIFFFMQIAMLALVALGLFENWMDIRKLDKSPAVPKA